MNRIILTLGNAHAMRNQVGAHDRCLPAESPDIAAATASPPDRPQVPYARAEVRVLIMRTAEQSAQIPRQTSVEPQVFPSGITRQSHSSLHLCLTHLHAPRVTASHRASGFVSSGSGARLGVSSETAAPGERTDRATPFLACTDRRTHHWSPHAHRLRLAERRQEGQRGQQ